MVNVKTIGSLIKFAYIFHLLFTKKFMALNIFVVSREAVKWPHPR